MDVFFFVLRAITSEIAYEYWWWPQTWQTLGQNDRSISAYNVYVAENMLLSYLHGIFYANGYKYL